MKTAIISDIHGNLISLNAALAAISRKHVDGIVCLGDIAATGPRPAECIDVIRSLSCQVVMGNTDERFVAGGKARGKAGGKEVHMLEKMDEWTASKLSASDFEFIRSFRQTVAIDLPGGRSMLCYHGSPRSNTELITSSTGEERMRELFSGAEGYELYIGGHSHVQMFRRFGYSAVINPGSIGLPFVKLDTGKALNVPRAEYAVVTADEEGIQVELCAVQVGLSSIVDDGLSSDLPHSDVWASDWQEEKGLSVRKN